MRSIPIRLLLCLTVVGGLAACDLSEGEDEDAGAGGEGGSADAMLGDIGGGGDGGGDAGEPDQGDIDGPCPDLGEAACTAREDCAPRRDVVGEFVDCRPLGEVACVMLDADDCAAREDCTWADDLCSPTPRACPEIDDAAACRDNGCHWYDDTCHDEPQPARCDQPDAASCENAGCEWTEDGCRPTPPACAELPMRGPCDARPDCRWQNNRCEDDPGQLPCAELELEDCAARPSCVWHEDACADRPMGGCAELGPDACEMRPDCVGEWRDCECPPGAEECDDCEEFFVCEPRPMDCRAVPLDACERTPGCTVAEPADCDPNCNCPPGAECDCVDCEAICVPDEEFRCGQLDERACQADPRCHVEYVEDCGGFDQDGDGAPDGDADFAPGRVPCMVEAICLPGPGDQGDGCHDIEDPDVCVATDGCGLNEVCDCGEPPPGCDCRPDEPCPCLVAVPCECFVECVPLGRMCEEIADPGVCAGTPGCRVEQACDCDDGGAPPPPDCGDCPPGEMCACEELIAPPCECRDICVGDDGGACWQLDERMCLADPRCEWVWGGEPGMCGCFIDENGEEICFCEGGDPAAGACIDRQPMDRCGDIFDAELCFRRPGCEWLPAPDEQECPCRIDEDGNEFCPPCPAGGVCVEMVQPDPCAGLDEAMCNADPQCHWEMGGGAAPPAPCVCEPGPDGQEICECDEPIERPAPVDGWCVFDGGIDPGPMCFDLDQRACEATDGCGWFDGGGEMCPPCEPGAPCPPCADPAAACLPDAFLCGLLGLDACVDDPGCMIHEVEVCGGGGGACPPDQPCDPIEPPPGGGECWVERFCGPADGQGGMDPEPMPLPEPAPR